MTTEIILRYIHFVAIFTIVGALVSEHLLLKKELTRDEIRRLSIIDSVYGLAALTLLAAGLTMWLGGVTKPTEFYSKNSMFHAKLTCFIAVGLLSIWPTVFFIRNRLSGLTRGIEPAGNLFQEECNVNVGSDRKSQSIPDPTTIYCL